MHLCANASAMQKKGHGEREKERKQGAGSKCTFRKRRQN